MTILAVHDGISGGIGLGTLIAVLCSWQRNRSVLWAIIAAIFSWLYVIYYVLTRRPEERK